MGRADESAVESGGGPRALSFDGVVAVILGALLLGVMALSCFPSQGPVIGSGTTDASGVPPAGQVWFGSDFDSRTFRIANATTTVKPGANLAAVAHLTATIGDGQAFWRLLRNEQLSQNGLLRFSGTGDFLGTTLSPIREEGRYAYDIVDLDGNVLAAGDFVVENE